MKKCNTCKHKEISIAYLPCRICKDFCLWDMPTSYKEIFIEELEEIKAEVDDLKCYGDQDEFRDKIFELLDKKIKEIEKGEMLEVIAHCVEVKEEELKETNNE